MIKKLSILFIFLLMAACTPEVKNNKDATTSPLSGSGATTSADSVPVIPLDSTSALSVQVLKDGTGLCNSGSFTQLPDNRDYFIGRMLINPSTNRCEGSNWQLGLFKMDWTNNILNFQKTIISPPVRISALDVTVETAYDPSVIKYNGEYWVAFECGGSGEIFKIQVSSCLAPFTIANGIDVSRLSVPIKGSKNSSTKESYSASVPKLLEFNGSLYMYWTVVHFKELNGMAKIDNIATRGIQLVQEISTARKIWAVRSGSVPVASYDSLSSEVLGPNANDPLSNNVADGFQFLVVDNKIIMTAGIGGTGCGTPVSSTFGCYRLQIYRSASPLGEHVFNSEVLSSPQLAFNPQEYSRIFYTPTGESFIMGMLIAPKLIGSLAPDNTLAQGFTRYPFNINKLVFTTGLTSVNIKPNPQNTSEVVNLPIDVLENFLSSCNANTTSTGSCRAAVTRYCLNQGYASGGFGPTDQSPTDVNIVCLKNNSSALIITPLSNLKKYQTSCAGSVSDTCNSAINQYCNKAGYEGGGFGPSEYDGTNVEITCLKNPIGTTVATTLGTLKTYQNPCSGTDVNSIACNSAVNQFCISQGYKSTYGILEHIGDYALAGCLK